MKSIDQLPNIKLNGDIMDERHHSLQGSASTQDTVVQVQAEKGREWEINNKPTTFRSLGVLTAGGGCRGEEERAEGGRRPR